MGQRITIGLTQEQLAEAMCVPKSTISAYENNKVDIKSSVVDELSKHLLTSPNYLHGYKEEQEQDPYVVSAAAIFGRLRMRRLRYCCSARYSWLGRWGCNRNVSVIRIVILMIIYKLCNMHKIER